MVASIDEETIREVSHAVFAAWARRDPDGVAAHFAEDVRIRDGSSPDWHVGRDGVRQRTAAVLAASSDLHVEQIDLLVAGSRYAERLQVSGTHDGEFLGVAPSGGRISIEVACFTTLGPDRLIVEDIQYVDFSDLFGQLGAG